MATRPRTATNVIPLNPEAMVAPTWPIAGDAPDLRTIVHDQMVAIKDQAVLIDAYQAWLNTQQAPPALQQGAWGSGTSSGTPATTLTVASVTNVIQVPSRVVGPGITTIPTNVIGQTGGVPGGAGTYTTDNPTSCSSAALTFVPPQLPSAWPTPGDAPTLTIIQQDQTAILRTQTALIQQYQQVLNDSQTPAPPTGP